MLHIIVAIAADGAIGKDGNQPFFISDDLKRFKSLTLGHPIIMGRRTFEALPKGALPGRRNIVVTRNAAYAAPGAEIAGSIEQAIAMVGDADAYVIGGGMLYSQAFSLADALEVTEIDAAVADADTFFPAIDPSVWQISEAGDWATDAKSGLRYRFLTYSRR